MIHFIVFKLMGRARSMTQSNLPSFGFSKVGMSFFYEKKVKKIDHFNQQRKHAILVITEICIRCSVAAAEFCRFLTC